MAQDKTNKQSPKFEQLLNEKKNKPLLTVNERYKIQIYSGDGRNKKALIDCKTRIQSIRRNNHF
jgi:hypothetical protein